MVLVLLAGLPAQGYRTKVVDPAGADVTTVVDVNDSGVAVGWARVGTLLRPLKVTDGRLQMLSVPTGSPPAQAFSVNADGLIGGCVDGFATVWQPDGSRSSLPNVFRTTRSCVQVLDDKGDAAGFAVIAPGSRPVAVQWRSNVASTLGLPISSCPEEAVGIGDSIVLVNQVGPEIPCTNPVAFIWTDGFVVRLAEFRVFGGIGEDGTIVGGSAADAVGRDADGVTRILPRLEGDREAVAFDKNAQGIAVGTSRHAVAGYRAVAWFGGVAVPLQELSDAAARLEAALAINDDGQIVGFSRANSKQVQVGFILTPESATEHLLSLTLADGPVLRQYAALQTTFPDYAPVIEAAFDQMRGLR